MYRVQLFSVLFQTVAPKLTLQYRTKPDIPVIHIFYVTFKVFVLPTFLKKKKIVDKSTTQQLHPLTMLKKTKHQLCYSSH